MEKACGIILKFKKDKISAADLKPEARLIEDLKLDSLDIAELLVLVEETFSIEMPLDVVKDLTTLGAAVEYIDKQVSAKG
jgi:acyl carrier protein